jgi:hypothetical protein
MWLKSGLFKWVAFDGSGLIKGVEKGWLSPHTLFTIATTLTLVGYLLKVYIDYWYQDKTSNRTCMCQSKPMMHFAVVPLL